jgi:hypothetical protein
MPALKSPSVIVLYNANYHNIKTEETVVPNLNQRKAVLQDYNGEQGFLELRDRVGWQFYQF